MWTLVFDLTVVQFSEFLGIWFIFVRFFSCFFCIAPSVLSPCRSVPRDLIRYINTHVHSVPTLVGLSNWTHPLYLAYSLAPVPEPFFSTHPFQRYRTTLCRSGSETPGISSLLLSLPNRCAGDRRGRSQGLHPNIRNWASENSHRLQFP